jgi:MFS family permease
MPAFARDVLGVGSRELGFLVGASGVGSIVGALHLAGRRTTSGTGRTIAVAMAAFGGGIVVFALSRSLAAALGILVAVGAAMIVQMATSNTYLQTTAPADLRGRIVSLYTLCFMGMAPFGSLLSGLLARQIGVRGAVATGGAVCFAAALLFAARLPSLKRAVTAAGESGP